MSRTLQRLEKIEAAIRPVGRMLVVSTEDEAECLRAGPHDTVIVTGVPRSDEWGRP